jgi:excisionase family DNA binding protein
MAPKQEGVSMAIATAPGRLLTLVEVADLLRVQPKRVRALVKDGELRSIRLVDGGRHRFRPEDLERFLSGEQGP